MIQQKKDIDGLETACREQKIKINNQEQEISALKRLLEVQKRDADSHSKDSKIPKDGIVMMILTTSESEAHTNDLSANINRGETTRECNIRLVRLLILITRMFRLHT